MAKKKVNPNDDVQGDVVYDRMPGADAITKEDAEGFNVDMNFETVSEDSSMIQEIDNDMVSFNAKKSLN